MLNPGVVDIFLSAAQHIAENGDPKIRNRDGPGNSGKFGVSVAFPKKTNPWSWEFQKVHFGYPILVIWGDFLGELRMAKVDMLGRGDIFPFRPTRVPHTSCNIKNTDSSSLPSLPHNRKLGVVPVHPRQPICDPKDPATLKILRS